MQVNILGFELSLAKNILIGELYDELKKTEDQEVKIHGRSHIPFFSVIDNYIVGLIVSFRNNKKSMTTERDDNGELIVTKQTLNGNQYGTEVSIFIINPETNRGLIYSYIGAVSPTSFKDLIKRSHNKLRKSKISNYRETLESQGHIKQKDIYKTAVNHFSGDFDVKLLVTPSDLKHILSQFSVIDKLTLRSEDALSQAGIFTQLNTYVKKAALQIDIEDNQPIAKVKSVISGLFKSLTNSKKEQALKIYGLSKSGEDLNLLVGENKDNFGSLKYDDYVEQLPRVKWVDYVSSAALIRLEKDIKSYTATFGDKPKNSWQT